MIDPEWMGKEKKVDPKFKGSIWQKLGYQNLLCPTCRAHLKSNICLNACHLTGASRKRFAALMGAMVP